MNFNDIEVYKRFTTILQIVGVLPLDFTIGSKLFNAIMRIYPYALFLPFTVFFVLLLWLEVLTSKNFNSSTATFNVAVTITAFIVRLRNAHQHGEVISALLEEWCSNRNFKPRTKEEHLMWSKSQRVYYIISSFYFYCCLGLTTSLLVSGAFLGHQDLPLRYWHPFDLSDKFTYWTLLYYDLMGFGLTCLASVAVDMLNCGLLLHVGNLIELVHLRLNHLNEIDTAAQFYKELISIIKFWEHDVKRHARICESIVSAPILSLIFSSSLIICLNIYSLQYVSFLQEPAEALYSVEFIIAVALQIYLPCYYGNLISFNSLELATAVYSLKWYELPMRSRRTIYFFMLSLKQPIVLRAGRIFNLQLRTFTTVINNAYSLLALLVNMNEK